MRDGAAGRCATRVASRCGGGNWGSGGCGSARAISTTGTNAAASPDTCVAPVPRYSFWCSQIHRRSKFAFTPALSAMPATDTPGCRQASINLCLSRLSKRRLPSRPTLMTLSGKKSESEYSVSWKVSIDFQCTHPALSNLKTPCALNSPLTIVDTQVGFGPVNPAALDVRRSYYSPHAR